ncbi:Iq-domain [Thalictrum thalictroides]|uniref:Iq-domain n=1 Tax=Thalictrum thalictroides TaxID=46969 RepID=A0A7J6WAI7_THATH|nr:Iq-domain [Thalictrum thalictroides]
MGKLEKQRQKLLNNNKAFVVVGFGKKKGLRWSGDNNARHMGKKVSWFSAIKKAFTPNSKQKLVNQNEAEKKNSKKWGLGKIKHGGTPSFIYRKPSSIEKILGDAEKEQQIIQPVASYDGWRTPPLPTRSFDERRTPPIPTRSYNQNAEINYNTRNTSKNPQNSAIKIQAAYRGYTARRNIRALKGMVRLQGVVRGQNVKRQTINAMKQMQLLTKVQSQIQLRRINLLEKQVLQNQKLRKNEGELENGFGRWSLSQPSEIGQSDEWDDSVLTKEEIDARMQRKVEALMKRERILAYANSHQWFRAGSTLMSPMELRSGALPWWWIRIEQQLPKQSPIPTSSKSKLIHPSPSLEPSPRPKSIQSRFGAENFNSLTPRSVKSLMTTPTSRTKHEPTLSNRVQQSNISTPVKRANERTNGDDFAFSLPLRDDDSFTSCPPLSRPNYMTPTISAKAKLRAYNNLNLNDRSPATPTPGQKKRFSLPLTQSFGSIKWKRASSIFSNNDSSSQRKQGNNYRSMSIQSIGNTSVDSTTSMPAALGRKPFNRFV